MQQCLAEAMLAVPSHLRPIAHAQCLAGLDRQRHPQAQLGIVKACNTVRPACKGVFKKVFPGCSHLIDWKRSSTIFMPRTGSQEPCRSASQHDCRSRSNWQIWSWSCLHTDGITVQQNRNNTCSYDSARTPVGRWQLQSLCWCADWLETNAFHLPAVCTGLPESAAPSAAGTQDRLHGSLLVFRHKIATAANFVTKSKKQDHHRQHNHHRQQQASQASTCSW